MVDISKLINIVGQRFGRLIVIDRAKNNTKGETQWLCKCDCGNEIITNSYRLRHGITKSCGCLSKEKASKKFKKYNKYYTYKDIVFVKFSNCDEYFICDLDDWNKLNKYCWYKTHGGYAQAWIKESKKYKFMHELIMQTPSNMVTDHIYQVSNGVCDNRKSNLRVCTQQQNLMNCLLRNDNNSGITGVFWVEQLNKWRVQITKDGKTLSLGCYKNLEEAKKARKSAEI